MGGTMITLSAAVLWSALAMAEPIGEGCLTATPSASNGPLGGGMEALAESGSATYGSLKCPGTFLVETTVKPVMLLRVRAGGNFGAKAPVSQAACESLVVTARTWGWASQSLEPKWMPMSLETRKTGQWVDGRCQVPVLDFEPLGNGTKYRLAARAAVIDPVKKTETPVPAWVVSYGFLASWLEEPSYPTTRAPQQYGCCIPIFR